MNCFLLCPGLLAPRVAAGGSLPRLRHLDRLFDRGADGTPSVADPLEALAGRFGAARSPAGDLPSAAMALFAESPEQAAGGCWFHADPVHLRADRDRLLLFGGPGLSVDAAEAEGLAEAFNALFREDGLSLQVTPAGRWMLRVPEPPRLETTPLYRVAGGPVDPHLPRGPDARSWNRWMTEAQMLFHAHPVNRARERTGQPAISGIWTWGGGELPRRPASPARRIAGSHPLAAGLARWTDQPLLDPDHRPDPAAGDRDLVVLWDRLWWPAIEGDRDTWLAGLAALDGWIGRALEELARGRLARLVVGDGERLEITLDRRSLRRFWRRRGGFAGRLLSPAGP